jgi:hypothetical protein
MLRIMCLGAVLALSVSIGADEPKKDPSKSTLPVAVKLLAKKDTYKLEVDEKQLKMLLEAARKSASNYPPPPDVDLVLEITNTSDREIQIWTGGDPFQINLQLKGPGALTEKVNRIFTLEFRMPEAKALKPGAKLTIPIKTLAFGMRGQSEYAYWTKPGDYLLTATVNTGISPPPPGSKKYDDNFGTLQLASDAVTLKVEKK